MIFRQVFDGYALTGFGFVVLLLTNRVHEVRFAQVDTARLRPQLE